MARAEVPAAPSARGREFRVDFSAQHLDVDADLGELSLSGHAVVTVGRYRLGGEHVRLKRGPRGIGVEGGGDIAFCSCDHPPVTLGYRSVTIAPPSDVLIQNAVLRAGGVPVFWTPYLWLRSPDRVALMFPTAEWRGQDGLLIGSGLHVPFDSNQGRPAARALDVGGYGYVKGGARVEAKLLTPSTTTSVRWDYRAGTALGIDAHGAASGQTHARFAYDADASLGARGRTAESWLEAAARRYDHARVGVGTTGGFLAAFGAAADAPRAAWLDQPLSVGPFSVIGFGGAVGDRTSYAIDLGGSSALRAGESRTTNAESRGLERASLESATSLGPLLVRGAAFELGDLLSAPNQARATLRAGAGLSLSLPLLRRFSSVRHLVAPEIAGRIEREYADQTSVERGLVTGGVSTALGSAPGGSAAAARLRVAGGWSGQAGSQGAPGTLEPVVLTSLGADSRFIGARASGVAEPRERSADATLRLRLGPRGGTNLTTYAEARTEHAPAVATGEAHGDLLPSFVLGGYDRSGLSTGADLTLALSQPFALGLGGDLDPLQKELLAVRSFARYRHGCGCLALGIFGGARQGRQGFDLGVSLDLMP